MPLLRAPRMSPDGTALAFVDEAGRVAILDLELQQLASARFVALSEPTWLPDGSGVLVAGLPAGSATGSDRRASRARPWRSSTPPRASSSAAQVAALHVVRLNRFADLGHGRPRSGRARRARPSTPAGRFAFIRLVGRRGRAAERLWVTPGLDDAGEAIVVAAGGRAASASFAPEPGSMVIGEAGPGGVWLLDLTSGTGRAAHRRWLAAALAALKVDPSRDAGLPYRRHRWRTR